MSGYDLLSPGEPVYHRFLNNRPMSCNGTTFLDASGTSTAVFHFTLMDTGATNTIKHIYLWVYGKVLGYKPITEHNETAVGHHSHSPPQSGVTNTCSGGGHGHGYQGIAPTTVPQSVKIIIDGTDRTAAIGNPNSRPAGMWDSVNNDWGNSAGVEWDTQQLDITAYIDLTSADHTISFQETGSVGGKISFNLYLV